MTRGSAASVIGRAVGLAAIVVLEAYWFSQPVPLPAKILTASILALSIFRPAYGLLALAGLAPVSTAVADVCGGGLGLGAQLIEQMALAIGVGVLIRRPEPGLKTRIGSPAFLLAAVALASAATLIPAAAAPLAPSLGDSLLIHQLALRKSAQYMPLWAPMFAALLIAECGLLGWAVERTVRQSPGFARHVIRMALIGHAGAGLLNFQALLGAAMRTGEPLAAAIPRVLTSARFSEQMDVHAAASALLLAGLAGLGLLDGSRLRRIGVGLLLVFVATGLWITGSRVAIVLAAVSALVMIGWMVAGTRRGRRGVIVGMAVVAVAVGAWLAMQMRTQTTRYNSTVSYSIDSRMALAKAGWQMFKESPAFGIGIAGYHEASARFMPASLGSNVRENAHNNFLQVLAEQGAVGLAVFLWWLGVVLIGGARTQWTTPTLTRGGLLIGIVTCVGTWMTGHPLLVPEFSFVFWLFCGLLAAMTPVPAPSMPRTWLPWILAAALLATVPSRASALRDVVDLEHVGFGVSLWQHDDAQRYREAGTSFSLYLPATGRPVEVPIRRAPGAPEPLGVEVKVGGRELASTSAGGDAWQTLLVVLPAGSRRFELVNFEVRPPASAPDSAGTLLRVGKAVAR